MKFFSADKNEKKILLSIVFAALGIRLFFLFFLESHIIENDWDFGYETGRIAKAIATGEGFSSPFLYPTGPTALMPPLYPCFLALIFKLFGVYSAKAAIAALMVNCFVSALICVPLYFIARMLFGRNVGYLSSGAFAIHPASVWYAVNAIWDTTIFTFLGMILICWLLLLPQRLNHKNAALFGAFTGFVILVKSVIIAFYPFMMIWLFLKSPFAWKKKIAYISTVCILSFVILLPWCLRNYAVFGKFSLRSNLGLELKLENCSETWNALAAGADSNVYVRQHPTINLGEFLLYKSLGEINYMNLCLDDARRSIWENPEKYLKLTLKRICCFWLGDLGEENEWAGNLGISFSISGLKKLFLMMPLPFMLIGIFQGIRRKINCISVPVAYALLLPVVYYLTHVCSRFRYPVEPMILVLAVYGFCALIPEPLRSRFCGKLPADC